MYDTRESDVSAILGPSTVIEKKKTTKTNYIEVGALCTALLHNYKVYTYRHRHRDLVTFLNNLLDTIKKSSRIARSNVIEIP